MSASEEREAVSASEEREVLIAIGQVADALAISERTLRYYEEVGLVLPAQHAPGCTRRYSEQQVERVREVREMKEVMGYSLEEIRAVFDAEDRLAALRDTYRESQDALRQARVLEEAIAMLDDQRTRVRAKYERLGGVLARMEEKAARYQEVHDRLVRSVGTVAQ